MVIDISWTRRVTMGTATSDQTMKNGLPTLDLGEISPYLRETSEVSATDIQPRRHCGRGNRSKSMTDPIVNRATKQK